MLSQNFSCDGSQSIQFDQSDFVVVGPLDVDTSQMDEMLQLKKGACTYT